MKWCLKVSLKYLTPSSALRGSWLRSPLYISASPTSLFLSAGPRFPFPSTVRSNLSFLLSVDLLILRDMLQPKIRPFCLFFCWEVIKIFLIVTHDWHCWNSQTIRTHTGPSARQDLLLLCNKPRSATTVSLLICSFCVKRT